CRATTFGPVRRPNMKPRIPVTPKAPCIETEPSIAIPALADSIGRSSKTYARTRVVPFAWRQKLILPNGRETTCEGNVSIMDLRSPLGQCTVWHIEVFAWINTIRVAD